MDRSKLNGLLEQFLKERRVSKGGWAEVTDEDKNLLGSLLQELLSLKFELDPDGDRPVEYVLVDRHKSQSLHYRAVPYPHKDASGSIRVSLSNLRIAMGDLHQCLHLEEVNALFDKL